ncbi:MAG: phytanoyl-CoA dioxygenase family protein [Armatimonadetes bacterium]|nr:phytanoyl-CoA dioxygenase family protein [Armatimonadota bacterium]
MSAAVAETARDFYRSNGYLLVEGLFTEAECDFWRTYFTDMVERGGDGWAEGGVDANHPDPLKRYPRLLQPHRGDKVAFDFMVDARINEYLSSFYDRSPLAVQTMVYFKPPGARGQALHQDNRYLKADPGTCMAAWVALEDIDEENGCLQVLPGTHDMPMVCPESAEMSQSFTTDRINLPIEPMNVIMKKGDVLFFNGSLVHGSGPNHSKDRFRRIIVGHYIEGQADRVAHYYDPVYRMDGTKVENIMFIDGSGGPCGIPFVEDGELRFRMDGVIGEISGPH